MQRCAPRGTIWRGLAIFFAAALALAPVCAGEGFAIAGRVTGMAGNPIKAAFVQLQDEHGDTQAAASTDAGGDFVLTVTYPGRYEVTARVAGFEPVALPVEVAAGTTSYQLNFMLKI